MKFYIYLVVRCSAIFWKANFKEIKKGFMFDLKKYLSMTSYFLWYDQKLSKCFKWIKNTQRCTFRYKIWKNSLILMRNAAILAIKTNYEFPFFTPWIYFFDPLFLRNAPATYIMLALFWICKHAPFIKSMWQFLPKKVVINSIFAWSIKRF